ncbi:heterokaryon incompatibility protein-domain-containing protein, partial [Cercophora newfieldiana]
MSPQAAKLCARCQLLNFDEIKAGCSVALSSSGEEYLAIAEKWHQDRADAVELWELPVPGDPPVEFLDSLPLLPALEASATGSGCELCGFIRRGIRSQAMDSLRAGKKAISIQQFLGQAVQCTIQMSWTWCGERGQDKTDRNQTGFLYLNVKIAEVEEDGGVGQGVTLGFLAQATETSPELSKWLRIPAPSASPPEQWSESAAAEWSRAGIGQCMHEHSHVTEDFRPKRLIDIQSRPIRLVRSESLEAPVTYAALSYCWGSETDSQAQLRTDSNEIEAQLLLGFEERQLPAVVRDALEVARSLSIPYLWVDAICIRQDKSGDSDWEEHAGIMHRVYGNAHLAYETYAWSKWSSRGWTLQEQVASTRLLAFGVKGNLFFSCPDGCWCFGREVEVSPFVSARQLGLDWTSFGCDSTSSSKWARLWRQLIFRYSLRARGFAYEQDIFPALSGIARSHSIATGMPETDYVAGFWRPSLLHDIFW